MTALHIVGIMYAFGNGVLWLVLGWTSFRDWVYSRFKSELQFLVLCILQVLASLATLAVLSFGIR